MADVQCLSAEHCQASEFGYLLLAFDLDYILQFGLLLLLGDRTVVVVRFGDMFGYFSSLGDYAWSQGTSELETFISLLLSLFPRDVDQFVYSPCLFEAVLAAEVAGLQIHLFAGGTHHGCLLAAAWSPAYCVVRLHS